MSLYHGWWREGGRAVRLWHLVVALVVVAAGVFVVERNRGGSAHVAARGAPTTLAPAATPTTSPAGTGGGPSTGPTTTVPAARAPSATSTPVRAVTPATTAVRPVATTAKPAPAPVQPSCTISVPTSQRSGQQVPASITATGWPAGQRFVVMLDPRIGPDNGDEAVGPTVMGSGWSGSWTAPHAGVAPWVAKVRMIGPAGGVPSDPVCTANYTMSG